MTTTTTGLTTEDDDDDDIARKNFNLLAINDQVYNKLKILYESKNNARKIKCKTKKKNLTQSRSKHVAMMIFMFKFFLHFSCSLY